MLLCYNKVNDNKIYICLLSLYNVTYIQKITKRVLLSRKKIVKRKNNNNSDQFVIEISQNSV